MDSTTIRASLEQLLQLDPNLQVFGSCDHRYKLNTPCKATEIEDFEREHNVTLPSDYKSFLTLCGNGGAGPFYGLFPLRFYDGAGGPLEKWTRGDGIVGSLQRPFPHNVPWNLADSRLEPPTSFASDNEENMWHEELEREYWSPRVADGCFPIAHQGCACRSVLVVTGPERGHVWTDARAGQGGIFPEKVPGKSRCTFAEWYENWLLEAVRQVHK